MKIYICLLALSVLCLSAFAVPTTTNVHHATKTKLATKPVTATHTTVASKKTLTKPIRARRSGYGSTGYGAAIPPAPVPVHTQIIQQDVPVSYSSQTSFVERPSFEIRQPVVQSYSSQVVAPVHPVAPSYSAEIVRPVQPIAPSYGQTQSIHIAQDQAIRVETIEPEWRNLCLQKKEGASTGIFYLPHPTKQSFYIQCDEHGQAYLRECPAGTIFTQNLVCENINDLHPVEEKKISLEQTRVPASTVGSYGSAPVFAADTTTVERTNVEIITEAPEFRELCLSKKSMDSYGAIVTSTTFYIAHPTNPSFFIQCDEFGKSFLRECPSGLIFSRNMVCERPFEIVSATGPVLAADQVQTVTTLVQEAPEFRELCLSKSTGLTVFYLQHPTKQSWYIQCDQYGRAFLRECPVGTIFTLNLVCESLSDLHIVKEVRPSLDTGVVGSYGSAPVFAADQVQTVQTAATTLVQEAPEFRELCLSKSTGVSVFYLQHPTKQSWYIQCDQYGRAFLRECPVGTIFTLNLVCESLSDLHIVKEVRPSLDVTVGSYGSAPVFAADTTVMTRSEIEIIREAPEFKELCLSKNAYGSAVSTNFYIPHPTNNSMYIQCNEFGLAYLKTCPFGTVFTSRLTCERSSGLEIVQVERPVLREEFISAPVPSYGQQTTFVERPVISSQRIETPILRDQPVPVAYGQQQTFIERPVLREQQVPVASYGQQTTVVERPVFRDQPVPVPASSYGQQQTFIERPVLRDQPVPVASYGQRTTVVERPIMREQIVQAPVSYGQRVSY